MEFIQELLMAASMAFIIYLLVAKLVSGGGDDVRRRVENETVVEDVKLERRTLKVKGTKRKKKVHFAVVDDPVVCTVDKYEGTSLVENLQGFVERSSGGLVAEERSGLSVESPELGFLVEEVVDMGSGIGELVVNMVGAEVCCSADGKVVDDEVDWKKGVKLGSDDDDDDVVDNQSSHVRVVVKDLGSEIDREMNRNDDVDGETVAKFDDQSERVGVVEVGEDQGSEIERELNRKDTVDRGMVKEFDDQSEHVGATEVGKDQGSEIARELNENENADGEIVVKVDDQSKLLTIVEIGEDQGNEIGRELNGDENPDEEIGVKLMGDDIVNEQNEQVGFMKSREDQGREIEKELDGNEKGDSQLGMVLASDDILDDKSQYCKIMEIGEIEEDQQSGIHSELNEGKESLIYDEDDDWEGIERSELEKMFATAANYAKEDQLLNLGSDVQMQLYGLHKVAMEGPCHEAQPMALKVSSRAKWNAWQKLGNMSPEVAMEQYIDLLSDKVPGWSKKDNSTEDGKLDSSETAMPCVPDPHMTTLADTSQKERKVEPISCSDGGVLAAGSNSVNEDEE